MEVNHAPVTPGSGRKDLWSDEETQQLQELVTAYGQKWVKICRDLPGRTPEQCSAKWYRSHQSKMDSSGWTEEESRILEEAYLEMGGKWVAIAKLLPNRTDKAVRNRFMRTIKNEEKLSADSTKKRDFLTSMPSELDVSANLASVDGRFHESPATALFLKDQLTKNKRQKKAAQANSSSSSSSSTQNVNDLMASASSATANITSSSYNPSALDNNSDSEDDNEGDDFHNMDIILQGGNTSSSSSSNAAQNNQFTPAKLAKRNLIAEGDPSMMGGTASGRKYNRSKWTPEEDDRLRTGHERYGDEWTMISVELMEGSRTALQCQDRFTGFLSTDHKRGMWSQDENDLLIDLVGRMGLNSWIEIAKCLPGRTPKQCNAKWYRSLNPEIVRNQWSNEENQILKSAHKQFGSKWAELARMLPGRTDKSVRNHWLCSLNAARQAPYRELPDLEAPVDSFAKNFIPFTADEIDALSHNSDSSTMHVLNVPVNSAGSTPRKVRMMKNGGTPATFQKHWSQAEDVKLEQLVNEMGFKWAAISREFGEGIHPRKQCRDRFLYQLKKDTSRNPWTEAEQMMLLKAQHASGNKWVEYNKFIKNHTENAVRHYWRTVLRDLTEKYLILTGKINKEALVSNYNFDQIFVNLLLTEEDFIHLLAYIRGHNLEEIGTRNTLSTMNGDGEYGDGDEGEDVDSDDEIEGEMEIIAAVNGVLAENGVMV
eukprot:gene26114-32645_t